MKPKIWVAFPAYGRTNIADTTASLYELGVTFGMNDLYGGFATASHTNIAELRNVFLTTFYYRTTASHLLMVDADMKFRAALIIDMLTFDQPLVGTVYPRKGEQAGWVGWSLPGEQKPENGFLEVAGVGGGIVLIRRDCVEKMIEAYPDLMDTRPPERQPARVQLEAANLDRVFCPFNEAKNKDGNGLSEDLSFCQRWRDIGGKVYANVSHPIGHIGPRESVGAYESFLSVQKTTTVSLAG